MKRPDTIIGWMVVLGLLTFSLVRQPILCAATIAGSPEGVATPHFSFEKMADRSTITVAIRHTHRFDGIASLQIPVWSVINYRQLTNVNACAVAALLNALLRVPDLFTKPPGLGGYFYADFDIRTNIVILSGPPDQIDRAQKFMEAFDAAAAPKP